MPLCLIGSLPKPGCPSEPYRVKSSTVATSCTLKEGETWLKLSIRVLDYSILKFEPSTESWDGEPLSELLLSQSGTILSVLKNASCRVFVIIMSLPS